MSDLRTYLAVLTAPADGLEQTLMLLLTERAVTTATGVRLDAIGKLVGQARGGLDDDDYRRFVAARISVNRSNGTRNEVYSITRLMLDDPDAVLAISQQTGLNSDGPATAVLRITETSVSEDLAEILMTMLRDTAAAGVRLIVEHSTVAESATMHFDVDSLDNKAMATAVD